MTPELQAEITQTLPLLQGWCQLEKALHLASLAIEVGKEWGGSIVEVGVFGGKSLIPMALALRHSGSKQFALGIDPMSIDAATEGDVGEANKDWWEKVDLEEVYAGFVKSVIDLKLTYHCRWIRLRSEPCLGLYPHDSIGLLHLDSNHSETVSCQDVETWGPRVRPGGYLVFDDSNWQSQKRALDKIKAAGFELIGEYTNGQPDQKYDAYQKQ